MAKYINLTKRPIPVSPSVGNSFIIPPKGTVTLSPDQESSPSLVALLGKGSLKRIADAQEEILVPSPIPPVARVAIELPVPELLKVEEIVGKDDEKTIKKVSPDKGTKKPL